MVWEGAPFTAGPPVLRPDGAFVGLPCLLWQHLDLQLEPLRLAEGQPTGLKSAPLLYAQTTLGSEGSSGGARVSSLQSRGAGVQGWRPFGQDLAGICARISAG